MNANASIQDRKISQAARAKALNYDQALIARALNDRFDGDLSLPILIGAAKILDADSPQWAFRIRKGCYLDHAHAAIAAAAA